MFSTFARGKLLLTNEYFVLDGGLALALPVQYGQSLTARLMQDAGLYWYSYDQHQAVWFAAVFSLPELEILRHTDLAVAQRLRAMLLACRLQNPAFLAEQAGIEVLVQSDFDRSWGLGSSSTLIAALARWADADAWQVLEHTLGGSGYDLACAYAPGPVLYQRQRGSNGSWIPHIENCSFAPAYSGSLYFVYLGQKQDSREGIERYKQRRSKEEDTPVAQINELTHLIRQAGTLSEFEAHLRLHEQLVGDYLQLPTVQSRLFADFPGVVKSLGAWGGDFALAVSPWPEDATQAWFAQKGYTTCIPWRNMVYSNEATTI